MNKRIALIYLALNVATSPLSVAAIAGCEVVEAGRRTPFAGKALEDLPVERESLIRLNAEFPNLNVIEKTFTGEVQTCSHCTGRHVACST